MIKLYYPKFWASKNALSTALLPFSYIYRFLGFMRKIFTKPIRLPGFVICVGNMTVGGTGKTQFVAWLAKDLRKNNYSFLILTKGYGSNLIGAKLVDEDDLTQDVGDESILLKKYGPVLAAKSIKDALPLIEDLKPQVIIFDDGMQNPGFIKDLTILIFDSERTTGNNRIFPAGPLRQTSQDAINQADIIIRVGNKRCQDVPLKMQLIDSLKPYYNAQIKLVSNIDRKKNYSAFSAIGYPRRFFELLLENNINLVDTTVYPDHHHYYASEIIGLKKIAKEMDAVLITTKKDYVKIIDTTDIICAEVVLKFSLQKELLGIIYEKIKAYR